VFGVTVIGGGGKVCLVLLLLGDVCVCVCAEIILSIY
jgi:hypothetical protein